MKLLAYLADESVKKLTPLLERALPRDFELEILPRASLGRSGRKKAPESFVYLDAFGLDTDRVLELAAKLGEFGCLGWGVLDRSGAVEDPGRLFWAGAKDYVAPEPLKAADPKGGALPKGARRKSTFNAGRLTAAMAAAGLIARTTEAEPVAFPGWDRVEEGSSLAVRFCYAAIGNQRELLERIGETRLHRLREDFAAFLGSWAAECGGIVWIRDAGGNLLLFPPCDEGINPVLAAFRLLLDRALIGYEVFNLETPLSFRFAFHVGHTMWRKPGSTGDIVSEDLNFIFHLGARASPDGVIVVTEESSSIISPCLRDLFAPSGDFEGRSLAASKRFRD